MTTGRAPNRPEPGRISSGNRATYPSNEGQS